MVPVKASTHIHRMLVSLYSLPGAIQIRNWTMPALSNLKSSRTRAKNALTKEEIEVTELLQREWNDGGARELERFFQSIGKVLLNLETKLARLEAANDKLADAYEQSEETDTSEQLQSTLNEESELTDGIIGKISRFKLLKETVERNEKWR